MASAAMLSGPAAVYDRSGRPFGTYHVILTNTAGRWWGFLEIDAVLAELDPDVPERWWWNRVADIVVMPENGGVAGADTIRMVIRACAATQHQRLIRLLIESG